MAAKDKAGGKGSGKFKVVLIIIILLILLIGGAISFWWFQLREPGAPIRNGTTQAPPVAQEATNDAADSAPATDIPRPVVNNVALPTVTVNLADAAGDRYLKVGMEVEVSSPDARCGTSRPSPPKYATPSSFCCRAKPTPNSLPPKARCSLRTKWRRV